MTMRIEWTQSMARGLRESRAQSELSQYELADQTGLTRPKVKRLEKHEIASVLREDVEKLEGVLGPLLVTKATKATKGARKLPMALVGEEPEKGRNVRRYLVKFLEDITITQLWKSVDLVDLGKGRRGRLCGVECSTGQAVYRKGDKTVLALWNDGTL